MTILLINVITLVVNEAVDVNCSPGNGALCKYPLLDTCFNDPSVYSSGHIRV